MSSGNRSVLIALLERADPADILKLQALEAQRSGEIARWLLAAKIQGSFYNFPGQREAYNAADEATAPTDEVAHQCLSGLLVRPEADTYLRVDPGGAAFYQPARAGLSSLDDTPWIFGFSPGQDNPAQLTFLANAGPGIRWDIVECQAAADTVESQDSRELFDPVGNVFNPATVNKIQASAFTFRIRRGVQGAGVPAIDPDWMPLCAVHVRTDATGFSNCDLYDIRPLTTETVAWGTRHPFGAPSSDATYRSVLYESSMRAQSAAAVNGLALFGYFRGHFGGYWSGGELRRNLPAANLGDFGATGAGASNFAGVNYETAVQRSGGFALAANTVVCLGAFFPRGYPRWARYSQGVLASSVSTRLRSGGARLPQGSRGILVVVNDPAGGTGQVHRNGAITNVALPAIFGETVNAFGHVVNFAAVGTAGNDCYPGHGGGVGQRFQWDTQAVDYAGALAPGPSCTDQAVLLGPAGTVDGLANPKSITSVFFTLINNLNNIPCNAQSMLCEVRATASVHNASTLTDAFLVVESSNSGVDGTVLAARHDPVRNDSGGDIPIPFRIRAWVPLAEADAYDQATVQFTHLIAQLAGTAGALDTLIGPTLRFLGYGF